MIGNLVWFLLFNLDFLRTIISGDIESENENAVTDSEDEDQAYQNRVNEDEQLIEKVPFNILYLVFL